MDRGPGGVAGVPRSGPRRRPATGPRPGPDRGDREHAAGGRAAPAAPVGRRPRGTAPGTHDIRHRAPRPRRLDTATAGGTPARRTGAERPGPGTTARRGAHAERPNPAEAMPGVRPDDRRTVAENVAAPPTPRAGAVRGTMGKPQLPRRRAQEHIAPQLRGGPAAPRPESEHVEHDPGLMAAFQRGIGLAEARQLESDYTDPAVAAMEGRTRRSTASRRAPRPPPGHRHPRIRRTRSPGTRPRPRPHPRSRCPSPRRARTRVAPMSPRPPWTPWTYRPWTRPPYPRRTGCARPDTTWTSLPGTTGAHRPDDHPPQHHPCPHPQRSRRPSYPKESIHHGERCADRPCIRSRLADERPRPARAAHHAARYSSPATAW